MFPDFLEIIITAILTTLASPPGTEFQFIDLDSKHDQGASVRAWLSGHPDLTASLDTTRATAAISLCAALTSRNGKEMTRAARATSQSRSMFPREFPPRFTIRLTPTSFCRPQSILRRGLQLGICGDIPEVSWEWLQSKFGFVQPKEAHEPRKAAKKKGQWQDQYEGDLCSLNLLGLLAKLGIEATLIDADQDKHSILCPWHAEHSGSQKTDGGSDTVVFSPESARPGFKCLHDHCSSRSLKELLEWAEAKDSGIVDRFCARKRIWEEGQDAPDGRPRIALGNQIDTEIHQKLSRIIGPKNQWFRFGRTLVAIRKIAFGFVYSSDPEEKYRRSAYITGIASLSALEAANEIERYVEPGYTTKDSENQLVFVPRSLSREFCERLIVSDVFLDNIPDLAKILSVPIPMLYNGALTWPKPGYDPRFKTFLPPNAPIPEEMSLRMPSTFSITTSLAGSVSLVSRVGATPSPASSPSSPGG